MKFLLIGGVTHDLSEVEKNRDHCDVQACAVHFPVSPLQRSRKMTFTTFRSDLKHTTTHSLERTNNQSQFSFNQKNLAFTIQLWNGCLDHIN